MARFAFSYYSMAAAALGLAALAGPVQAQERSAMGNTEVQMTWSSLTNLVAAANNRAAAVESRMNQMIICNKKFKLYAPGYAGADGDGCIENALIKQLANRMDAAEAAITDTNTKLTALDTKVTQNITRIDGNVAALSVKLEGLIGRVGVAEGDIRNLNTKVEDLNAKVAQINARIEAVFAYLDGRISGVDNRVTTEVNALNQRIATLNAQIADLYNRTNDLYNRTNDLYGKTSALETAVNAIRQCGAQLKLTNMANQCVEMPFQKETEYVESNGWMSSPYTLACTLGRKISYAMLNVTTKSNQLACGRSGANCDGNATSTLLGQTQWSITPDRGKYVSAYIECK